MNNPPTILICPLNWGLGHASRDFFIIRHLMRCGHRVVVGGDKSAMTLLASEFPELQVLRIPDIPICYSRFFPAWVVIFLQVPKFIFGIIREHYLLKNIIRTVQADIIISDNRYGLWNKDVISILISHQLSPRLPARMKLLEPFLARLKIGRAHV